MKREPGQALVGNQKSQEVEQKNGESWRSEQETVAEQKPEGGNSQKHPTNYVRIIEKRSWRLLYRNTHAQSYP